MTTISTNTTYSIRNFKDDPLVAKHKKELSPKEFQAWFEAYQEAEPERDWNEGLDESWFINQEKMKKEAEAKEEAEPERDWNEGLDEAWFINQEKMKKEAEEKPSILSKIKNWLLEKAK